MINRIDGYTLVYVQGDMNGAFTRNYEEYESIAHYSDDGRTAWRWHPDYGDPCWGLMNHIVGDGLPRYLVKDLSSPKGRKLSDKTATKVLLQAIVRHMKPGKYRRFTDKASRNREQCLCGYMEWGYGRHKDGSPFVYLPRYVCYNMPSRF